MRGIRSNRRRPVGEHRVGTSTIVLVGVGFDRQLFDERSLFPEPMGRDYVAFGQVGQYSYGANTYRFVVMPDRIVLQHNADAVLSDELSAAADHVGEALQSRNQGHGVTALGFNLEAVFPQADGGVSGEEYCDRLCNSDRIRQAIGSEFHEAQCRVVVLSGGVRYTLRIEPHLASNGANLFLSVNGHQDIAPADNLCSKLRKAGSAREYIESVCSSLSREFKGDEQ